ncbi:PerC family transcriptional regulator [Escherichia coli]
MITDKKAEVLEQRGLWRRAAARWQELLLNYLQEDDRICIQRRIQHCLKRAKMKSQRATSQEEFSFRLLRSSAIQTEKEMGIYRDRKTGNDSNLLIVFYVQIMPDDFVMQLHRF